MKVQKVTPNYGWKRAIRSSHSKMGLTNDPCASRPAHVARRGYGSFKGHRLCFMLKKFRPAETSFRQCYKEPFQNWAACLRGCRRSYTCGSSKRKRWVTGLKIHTLEPVMLVRFSRSFTVLPFIVSEKTRRNLLTEFIVVVYLPALWMPVHSGFIFEHFTLQYM